VFISEEFVWKEDYFAFHITKEQNMISIIENGLIPQDGERCKSVMDKKRGIFCLCSLNSVQEWALNLYKKENLEDLKLLRFNLKNRKWHIDEYSYFLFSIYLPNKVL